MAHSLKKRPSPLSIRLSDTERAQLEARAGRSPLGAYVKAAVFGADAQVTSHRRTPRDAVLLAQLLAVLGRSRIAGNLDELASAVREGSLGLDDETIGRLNEACEDIRLVHNALMRALGKQERDRSAHERRATPAFNVASRSGALSASFAQVSAFAEASVDGSEG